MVGHANSRRMLRVVRRPADGDLRMAGIKAAVKKRRAERCHLSLLDVLPVSGNETTAIEHPPHKMRKK